MTLFLATFSLKRRSDYPSSTRRPSTENLSRLVWAEDEQQAREKLIQAYLREPDGTHIGYWMSNLEVTEAVS